MQSSGSRTFLYSRPGALQWLLALLIASALAACDLGNDPVTARVTAPADVTSTVTGTVHTVESDTAFRVDSLLVNRPPWVAAWPVPVVAGSRVMVTGSVRENVLTATEIIVMDQGRSHSLHGQVEAIDPSRRTLHMFGIEFFWHAGSFGMPANLAVGDWISVQAHSSRVVRPTYIYGTSSGISVIEGEWISDLSPPIGFTLDSVSKFTAQVTSTATISWSFMGPDDCYASNLLSNDEFFRHMSEQRPAGYSIVHAEGRFEGGILIANKVWFCHE